MKRIVVGISGASGAVYGVRLLEALSEIKDVETHLIISDGAKKTLALETTLNFHQVAALADRIHDFHDLGAPVSSGSFLTNGMIVAPCSMKSLSAIANSFDENLLVRAADVALKEGRKLVLIPRETPMHKGHLSLLLRAAELGASILPPIPAFYHNPRTIQDIVDHTVGKALDLLGVEHNLFKRWEGGAGDLQDGSVC